MSTATIMRAITNDWFVHLVIGAWNLFGIWCLEFGISYCKCFLLLSKSRIPSWPPSHQGRILGVTFNSKFLIAPTIGLLHCLATSQTPLAAKPSVHLASGNDPSRTTLRKRSHIRRPSSGQTRPRWSCRARHLA